MDSLVVLVGHEGSGKTWVALDWLITGIDKGQLPLVIPIPAKKVQSLTHGNLLEVIEKQVAEWSQVHSEAWTVVIKRWLKDPTRVAPTIVLFVDGLNERHSLDWASLFAALGDSDIDGRVVILATDQPYHWTHRCAGLHSDFQTIEVPDYSESEVIAALHGTGLSYESIPDDLQALIHKPLYLRLAVDNYKRMLEEADFSAERLMLLYFQTRQSDKLGYPLSLSDFVSIIERLAGVYRERSIVDVKSVRDLVADCAGHRAGDIYEAIVTGGLLIQQDTFGRKWRVQRTPLVFGLGMLLAEDLRDRPNSQTDDEIQQAISLWFEALVLRRNSLRCLRSKFLKAILMVESAENGSASNRVARRNTMSMSAFGRDRT